MPEFIIFLQTWALGGNKPFKAGAKFRLEYAPDGGLNLYRLPRGKQRYIDFKTMCLLIDTGIVTNAYGAVNPVLNT